MNWNLYCMQTAANTARALSMKKGEKTMKTTLKHRGRKLGAGLLAAVMFGSTLCLTTQSVMAAEPVAPQTTQNYALPSEEEMQAYFSNYVDQFNQNPDMQNGNPASFILIALRTKVTNKYIDKGLGSAFDLIFGGENPNKEVIDKLNELNGKVDEIIGMLCAIMKYMQTQEIKNSIDEKNRFL